MCGGGSGHEPAHAGFVGKGPHIDVRSNSLTHGIGEGMLTGLSNPPQVSVPILMMSRCGMW